MLHVRVVLCYLPLANLTKFVPHIASVSHIHSWNDIAGYDTDQTDVAGASASEKSVAHAPQSNTRKPRVEHVQLKGKNTFAVPRNIAALARTSRKPETKEQDEEKPKSNDEFRKMFSKG